MKKVSICFAASIAISAISPNVIHAESRSVISIAAGPLDQAIISLSRQAGISIGMVGKLPAVRVLGFTDRLSAEKALQRILRGTGWKAVRVGPSTWRIEAIPNRPQKSKASPKPKADSFESQLQPAPVEIVVTAAKRTTPLETTPVASTILGGDFINRLSPTPATEDVVALIDGMVLSNTGPGQNRAFIRGVGDSPFNGQTQSTVSTVLNDVRINFNAPEPELRLIDVDRVEILKGPQGPLYGTGALGGVYRIVTAAPVLDHIKAIGTVGVESLSHGGIGGSANAVLNVPIVADRLGVRMTVYQSQAPGWIDTDRTNGNNSNSSTVSGARVALRYQPDENWTVDLLGLAQALNVADSKYTTELRGYRRFGVAPEPFDNDFLHGQLTIRGKIGSLDFLSTTGLVRQNVESTFDASSAAAFFGLPGKLLFKDKRQYQIFNQEVRLSGTIGSLHLLSGLSYLQAGTQIDGALFSDPQSVTTIGALHQAMREVALFGELTLPLSANWNLDAGLRFFTTNIDNERVEDSFGPKVQDTRKGASPSLAISFQPNVHDYYYARFASALRPKGLNAFAPIDAVDFGSDELQSLEIGGRWKFPSANISAKLEFYGSQWAHIQSDYLLPNGLVATRNSGSAFIYGAETSLLWKPLNNWSLEAGADWQHARLEKPDLTLGYTGDQQLAVVPDYKTHVELSHEFQIGGWRSMIYAKAQVTGPSRLSLSPGLDRGTGSLVSIGTGIVARYEQMQIRLICDNLLNSSEPAATFGNPFSIQNSNQKTPMRPRRISLSVSLPF